MAATIFDYRARRLASEMTVMLKVSSMMWLPQHGVGAVVLTNGDPGWLIRWGFRRKLLEVLFDGI